MMNRTKYTAQKSISRKEMGRINGGKWRLARKEETPGSRKCDEIVLVIECPSGPDNHKWA